MLSTTLSKLRIVSFNIAKNYDILNVLLERECNHFDVLCIQEPPWRLIRHAPSTVSREGTEVVGAPRHPQWLCLAPPVAPGSRPCVLIYVSRRLDTLRPMFRRDLIDDHNVMMLTLFVRNEPIHLINVYSDDQHWGHRPYC
jgi:hypothetical protein